MLALQCAVDRSFVKISPDLCTSLESMLLVTPNERLAREYHRAYAQFRADEASAGRGPRVWATPGIISFSRLIHQGYQSLREFQPALPAIASSEYLHHLALSITPEVSDSQIEGLLKAWETTLAYDIPLHAVRSQCKASFVDWLEKFTDELSASELVPAAHLPDVLITQAPAAFLDELVGSTVLWIPPDEMTQPERRLVRHLLATRAFHVLDSAGDQSCAESEADLLTAPASTRKENATVDFQVEFSDVELKSTHDPYQEVAQAAHWAKQVLADQPDAKVGIVVPDLASRHSQIARQVGVVLDPNQGSSSVTFDISGGQSLAAQPVWQSAKLLLKGLQTALSFREAQSLAASPFVAISGLQTFVEKWSRSRGTRSSLALIARSTTHVELARILDDLHSPEPAPYGIWVAKITELLEICGWPQTQALQSNQYQAALAIKENLAQTSFDGKCTLDEAIATLAWRLNHTLFAPERGAAPVQVLGLLEGIGLTFSHLWLCGADSKTLPATQSGIPHLPPGLCRDYGVPRCDQSAEAEFAFRTLSRLNRSADHFVASFCTFEGDVPLQPSPFISHLSATDLDATPVVLHPYIDEASEKSVTFYSDQVGEPLPAQQTRGGVRLLDVQANCPFKAYAEFRLDLTSDMPLADLPDYLSRGNFVHDALFSLLTSFPSRDALAKAQPDDIGNAVDQALIKHKPPLPRHYQPNERERLIELLSAWVDFELERDNFAVHVLEEAFEVTIGPLVLRVRVDRIDELPSKARLVIDYKTGAASLRGLTDSPPTHTQLPLYSLLDLAVEGVAYARVNEEPTFIGVGENKVLPAKTRTTQLKQSWQEQREEWRSDLGYLAQQFAAGNASVTPAPGACDYCDYQPFCRVGRSGVAGERGANG